MTQGSKVPVVALAVALVPYRQAHIYPFADP